jgi:predicted regulator of Ras-like GTPase activity (Roadblock/LC7/MglB family)
MANDVVGSPDPLSEMSLFDACEKLRRDAGGRKVMVCGADGEVLAHAGPGGALDEPTAEQIASLVADVLHAAASRAATEDLTATLGGGLGACATAVGTRAALVVLFDASTSLERVRTKMKRARDLLLRLVEAPATTAHS